MAAATLSRLRRRFNFGLNLGCDGSCSVRMVPATAQYGVQGDRRGDGDGNYCAHKLPNRLSCGPPYYRRVECIA